MRPRVPRRRASEGPSRFQVPGDLDLFAGVAAAPGEPEPVLADAVGEQFPGASASSAVAVGTVTRTAKDLLEGAFIPLWVRGEISDFKSHRNGHWYFCLRDETAQLRCVVWSRDQSGIPAAPDEGMQVAVFGQLSVYAARGEMQFTVRKIEAAGDGLWRKALERTRAKLEAEGLLAPERKRALPRHPRVIAVVTSPDGAALHDIVAVIRRRAPQVRVIVVPAAVQGESAPDELCRALDRVGRWGRADTVIVGRGGGAREDLWAFNDERVARAVARCPIPTISAVGHEIDITICDLVADLRAPTPSAAAETAVRAAHDLRAELDGLARRALAGIASRIEGASIALHRHARDLSARSSRTVERRRAELAAAAGRLHALSPLATLARGYAIASDDAGHTLASTEQFAPGVPFDLRLRDGSVRATTDGVSPAPASDDSA